MSDGMVIAIAIFQLAFGYFLGWLRWKVLVKPCSHKDAVWCDGHPATWYCPDCRSEWSEP